MPLNGYKGQIKFLRVGDPTNVWGSPNDAMHTEVVVILDSHPEIAAGIQLEDGDPGLPSRLAMLSVLRDAYVHKLQVGIAVDLPEGKKNGTLRRVEYV
jgi:hypothetical protein